MSLDANFWRSIDFSLCKQKRVRDITVICLVSRVSSSSITHIDLSGPTCSRITNISLFHIARQCPKLRKLYISNSNRVTSTGVEIIARHCPYIEVLGLSKCPMILNRDLGFVVRRSKMLCELDVSGCAWVTDGVLVEISQQCRYLTYLNIEGCKKVSDTGLISLANFCSSLKHINLGNTKQITNDGMQQFLSPHYFWSVTQIIACEKHGGGGSSLRTAHVFPVVASLKRRPEIRLQFAGYGGGGG